MKNERTITEASQWLAGQASDSFDWDGFTAWLEADPSHRQAYDELALIDRDLDELPPLAEQIADPANDNRPHWGRWAAGGAIAASLAFGLMFLQLGPAPQGDVQSGATVYAAASERRDVDLGDGIQASLAPNSLISVTGHEIAAQGEVYFAVDHRDDRPLTVHSGPLTVQDIGTRFAVRNDGATAEVAVEEGRLSAMLEGNKARHTVRAGQRLRVELGSLALLVDPIEPAAIADWRDGTLTFQNAPLVLVAERLSRYSGTKVSVDQVIGDRRFSGDVAIGKGEDPAQSVAGILGIRAVHQKDGIRLRNP